MNKNTRYLTWLWLLVGVVVLLSLGSMTLTYIGAGNRGRPYVLTAFALSILLVLAFVFGVRQWLDKRQQQLLQAPDPGPLVTFLQGGGAIATYSAALVYVLYGDNVSAEAAMDKVDWSRQPPLIGAMQPLIEALICYLGKHDYAEGLRLARVAQGLGDVPSALPGAKPRWVPTKRMSKSARCCAARRRPPR